jgi:DNA polymerase-3 subunit delta
VPITVLAGEEDFLLYRHLNKLKDSLLAGEWATFNYTRIDSPTLPDVLDNALAVPFGMGNKVIVFDRCDFFSRKKPGKKEEKPETQTKTNKQIEQLEESLSSVAHNTHLIFACTSNFDSTLKLSKVVAKFAQIEKFEKPKFYVGSSNSALENFVRKEAKSFGATIDDAAVTYLLDGTEANLRQISQELEKAATYILPERHITYKVVVDLSPHHAHIFTLLDHWLSGRSARALESANELLSRQPAMQVLATMQTFLGKWIQYKATSDSILAKLKGGPGVQRREIPFQDLVKKVAVELKMQDFIIKNDMARLKNHSTASLIEKRKQLTEFEHLVKTGQLRDRDALELFIYT